MLRRALLVVAILVVAGSWQLFADQDQDDALADASAVCGDCHEEYVDSVALGPHDLFESSHWDLAQAGLPVNVACEACHGDATQHVEEEGDAPIFAFKDALPSDTPCLTCHQTSHPRFVASPHAEAGMSCTSCHSIHSAEPAGPPLLKAVVTAAQLAQSRGTSATCYECHQEAFAEFELNERHRLQEGILECTSCHDPHAPARRTMLTSAAKEPCVTCHTDKEGPFVFEHGSIMVEGCTSCHSPHGSPNRHMLRHQDGGELCFTCHAAVPQFHFGFSPVAPPRFDTTTNCVNCHSAIHGSNFDPFFLK